MTLRVYTGLPASGKTKTIISELEQQKEQGNLVVLFLSAEHEELTNRPNVRDKGLMGCRDQTKSFPIDHVVDTNTAAEILSDMPTGSLAAFDEAQYFQPGIVEAWQQANDRGVNILVGTPSAEQISALASVDHEHNNITIDCSCGNTAATRAVYKDDLVYPTHLCEDCYKTHMNTEIQSLLTTVHESEPFPNEQHTYQPFYGIDMADWNLVRQDCDARLGVILDAVNRNSAVIAKLEDAVQQPSFIDLGCCSGFFADGMANQGFRSAGVDVSANFISWATQLAHIKGQAISYQEKDLLAFLTETDKHYDVISTFATVQWVMAQKGYEAGLTCFEHIFNRADAICVIEMGYTTEDIYSDKITDRPTEIDRNWVMNLMESSGLFHTIELHPAGENGIWRDIFVGFKVEPSAPRTFDDFPVTGARQTSSVQNYWQDGWVGDQLLVNLQALAKTKKFMLEGWRPDNSKPSEIQVKVGEVSHKKTVKSGVFKLELPVNLNEGDYFDLGIRSSESFVPEGDARNLAFVLRELQFR